MDAEKAAAMLGDDDGADGDNHADSARARARRRAARMMGRDDDTPLRPPVFETPSPPRPPLASDKDDGGREDHVQTTSPAPEGPPRSGARAPASQATDPLASARSVSSAALWSDSEEAKTSPQNHAEDDEEEAASMLHALEMALREGARAEIWRQCESRVGDDAEQEGQLPSVEDVLAARLERLMPIVEDVESGEVGAAADLASELATVQKSNLELSWELLWQTAQTRRSAAALIAARGKLAEQCTRPELNRKIEFLETARAKCGAMQAQCLLETYGREDQQEALEQIAQTLDTALAETEAGNAAIERKLEELKLLPLNLVNEYDDLQAALSERRDYIRRLEEGSA